MTNKKWRIWLLPVLILALTGACAQSPAVKTSFKPGTYTATAGGIYGPVVISVTFSEDTIVSIKVDSSNETEGVGSVALEKIAGLIIREQSLAIDAVAGATFSSAAIFQAVENCVNQAGGSVPALMTRRPAAKSTKTETLTTDLVIVGAGGAGMTAASRAARAGLDVILLEKMAFAGGSTIIAGSGMIVTGSRFQREHGVPDDSPESLLQDLLAFGRNLNYMPSLNLFVNNIGSTVDWMQNELNMQFIEEYGVAYPPSAEHSHNRLGSFLGGLPGFGKTLVDGVKASGARLMLETRAESLIVEGGAVTGVTAKGSDGTTYTIRAKNVLLTTGGFGNNVDMLPPRFKDLLYYGPVSSTGDGHRMAQAIGAKFINMEYGKIVNTGIEVAPRVGRSASFGNYAAIQVSGILVDKSARRVVDEGTDYDAISHVQMEVPDRTLYMVMDAASFRVFRDNLGLVAITQENVDQWLQNNGSRAPVWTHGNTLEEAAAAAKLDGAALRATVNRYNSFVRQQKDDDFGRLPRFLKAEIGAGPYYIVAQKPRFATTVGGPVVNGSLQVLREDGSIIPNLYAAGEVTNILHGYDAAGGANIGWAVTSGRLAADFIVAASK